MEKVLFLILLTVMTSAELGQTSQNNSTCSKKVMKEKVIQRNVMQRTTTSGWIWWIRKTIYRSVWKSEKVRYVETVQVCCQGYINITGICEEAPCPENKYGVNCTMDCPCVQGNYDMCDTNGTCLCGPGWTGENCSKACEEGKYGEDCKYDCECKNKATCNHVTGICNCSSVEGKTGHFCDEDCPPAFYGRNCSLACNCSEGQSPVCDSVSGVCVCVSGKRGDNCAEDCISYTFGPNCVENCTCVAENSLSCNSSTGECYCKSGWRGDNCQTRCDLLHYGDKCAQNCSCNDTEVCDNENGSCSPANICLATNTLNCIALYNMTCHEVSENCDESNTSEPSLLKEMQNICCNGDQTQSVCIAKEGCSCRKQYAGSFCNDTILSPLISKEKAENETSDSEIIIVPVVISLLVVLLIVLTVVVVKWRKRITLSSTTHNVQNPGYGKTEPYMIQDKPDNGTSNKLGQDNLEMHDTNIHHLNDYGYDVHMRDSNLNQNENYASTTNFGEEYDHIQRNNHRDQETDDSYSHQNFLDSRDEYSHARIPDIETNNEYDTAKASPIKDALYCNTKNMSSYRKSSSDV